ncbi:protein translocase subunit SecF [Candidatus Dependentiae bacterium]|nr:protein translocase subunit SecF [Candidatus Dependentiae bacterium]
MINFLKYKSICFVLSISFLITGVIAYFYLGGFKYHIDFAGGAEVNVSFEKPIDIGILRKAISGKGWKDTVIQSIGKSGKDFIVRIGGATAEGLEEKFRNAIDKATPGNTMTVNHIDWVGAAVGKDMKKNAIIAVLLSLLLILLYVAVRSKYGYAFGAVAAIAHDMLAVLIFLLIFREPISLSVLAAILAILGYSLNDTIVIFNRIKENVKKMRGESLEKIVNTSINQSFKRTLLTSFSTLLAVGSFFVLGGETLRGFSFAMLIGIVIGTYSSIYVASPVMMFFGVSSKKEKS